MNDNRNKKTFGLLYTLKIQFQNMPSFSSGFIYANKKNQIEILITVDAISEDGEPYFNNEREVQDATYLCSFFDGKPLNQNWQISNEKGPFCKAVKYDTTLSRREPPTLRTITRSTFQISKFISFDIVNPALEIAVGINIPGIGNFDTSMNGTPTLNSGSVFKSPSRISVSRISPIDYTDNRNVMVIDKGWKYIMTDALFRNGSNRHSSSYRNYAAIIRYKKISIITANKYNIIEKRVSPTLPYSAPYKDWFYSTTMPHAMNYATDDQALGAYLTSWFIETRDRVGYFHAINEGWTELTHKKKPPLYFTSMRNGEFNKKNTFSVWPQFSNDMPKLARFSNNNQNSITLVCHQINLVDHIPLYLGAECRAQSNTSLASHVEIVDEFGNEGIMTIEYRHNIDGEITV
ncbi:hypothetical protein ACIWZF_001642 [Providencia stuartii]